VYVISFYSYKGGAGRSMALVNVGVQLARAGKRVLLVDFDLEAPSLSNYNLGIPACKRGVIDYVGDYLQRDRAPDVRDFISDPRTFPTGGTLCLMPAGTQSPDYQGRLATVNWLDLYENRSGYMLIEELKAQWAAHLAPDYVLIDSRTGYSDVSGICTRQLPNAVCFVFVPNRQHLEGLATVVEQVRDSVAADPVHRPIELFFLESNVPYHDDERRTLDRNRKIFFEKLKISAFHSTIHHYPHLSLFDQSVFVEEFPDTTLASEYRELTETLRRENLADRDAVMPQLKQMEFEARITRGLAVNPRNSNKLSEISSLHGTDAEVCFWLGRISRRVGDTDEALIQLNQAIERGYDRPEAYLERASLELREQTLAANAVADLRRALELSTEQPKYGDVHFALRTLVQLERTDLAELSTAPALQALSQGEQVRLAGELNTSDEAVSLAYSVLNRVQHGTKLEGETLSNWRGALSLCCIRLKKFAEAIQILKESETSMSAEQSRLFNLGVARWAESEVAPTIEFTALLQLHTENERPDANYYQCMAIVSYTLGDRDRARLLLDRAKRLAENTPIRHFSAFRYLRVSPRAFVSDCHALAKQMNNQENLTFPAVNRLSDTDGVRRH
jgi:MinD-like ATPase involved in chromosome partitioning or flagellar assembly